MEKSTQIKEEKAIKTLNLPVSIIKRIDSEAGKSGRTVSGYMTFLLRNYYQQLDEK